MRSFFPSPVKFAKNADGIVSLSPLYNYYNAQDKLLCLSYVQLQGYLVCLQYLPCGRSGGHFPCSNDLKIGQNVCLEILDEFELQGHSVTRNT